MGDTLRALALTELIEKARADEHAFWDGMSEAQRSAQGTPDHWSAKDITAHVLVWNDRLAADLEAAARDEAPPERMADFNEANRQIFEANRERSWQDLLEYEEAVYARLVTAVKALNDEVLDDPARFEWTQGRPLWWRVAFTTYFHPLDHLSHLYIEAGDFEMAEKLQKRVAQDMATLDDTDAWQGTVTYNLGCFYALNDQPQAALDRLRQAFKLNPGLIDWSKEDSDMDSLRELPEFQALYED